MKKLIYLGFIFLLTLYSCNSVEKKSSKENHKTKVDSIVHTTVSPQTVVKNKKIYQFSKEQIDSIKAQLRGDFDTTLFYFTQDSNVFFYVEKGQKLKYTTDIDWNKKTFKMGLLDRSSKVIIPTIYDIIYNPDALKKGYIAVKKDSLYNVYDLKGRKYFQKDVEHIYPVYQDEEVLCQFKDKGTFGWLDFNGERHIQGNMQGHEDLAFSPFLSKNIKTWKNIRARNSLSKHATLIFNQYGSYFFTPSWFSELGISELLSEISYTNFELAVDTFITLKNGVHIITTKYLIEEDGGADIGDYTLHMLSTVNSEGKIMNKIKADEFFDYSDGNNNYNLRVLGDTLLEIQQNNENYSESPYYCSAKWIYYSIDAQGKLLEIKTNRDFAFTHFVEMTDEFPIVTYIVDIGMPGEDNPAAIPSHGVLELHEGFTISQLDYMRNEIFASYGYKFKGENWQRVFSKQKWYKPMFDNVNDSLTTIEKKNIAFILNLKKELENTKN